MERVQVNTKPMADIKASKDIGELFGLTKPIGEFRRGARVAKGDGL
jgi:hypothetical protein